MVKPNVDTTTQVIVEINGDELVTDTVDEMVLLLRQEYKMTVREISEYVPRSRQTVHTILTDYHANDSLVFPAELIENEQVYTASDDELAKRFKLLPERVAMLREKHVRREIGNTNLSFRRQLFVNKIYGDKYRPGPNFAQVLCKLVDQFPPGQKRDLTTFYIHGLPGHSGTRRVNRAYILNRVGDRMPKIRQARKEGFIVAA